MIVRCHYNALHTCPYTSTVYMYSHVHVHVLRRCSACLPLADLGPSYSTVQAAQLSLSRCTGVAVQGASTCGLLRYTSNFNAQSPNSKLAMSFGEKQVKFDKNQIIQKTSPYSINISSIVVVFIILLGRSQQTSLLQGTLGEI